MKDKFIENTPLVIKKSIVSLTLSFASIFSLQAVDSPLPEKMLKIMNQSKYQHASFGIYAKDTETGATLFELNKDKFFLPASTTKLFSVEALLKTYGDDYRFNTPIFAIGKIENGVLNGNLILVGQGDLTFGGRQDDADTIQFTNLDHIVANHVPGVTLTPQDPLKAIKDLSRQVKEKGIKEVNGDVLIDDRLFEIVTKRDMILSPVMINENMIDFVINPGSLGQAADVTMRPKVLGYTLKNELVTVKDHEPLKIELTSDDSGQNIVIKGSIPASAKDLVRTFSIKDPKLFARSALIEALENEGIKVNVSLEKSLKLPAVGDYKNLSPIATWRSPPLSEYAKLILKVSHNLGADLVPLLLSVKAGKTSFDDGMKLFGDFVSEEVKIPKNSFVFIDGAGGDENRLTPYSEVTLLDYVRNQPKEEFQNFYDALPILGVDGSLADFGKGTDAVNKVRAKTGTGIAFNLATEEFFLTTQTLAGYVEGKNGHLIEFMISVNNGEMAKMDDIFPIFEDIAQMSAIIYELSDNGAAKPSGK